MAERQKEMAAQATEIVELREDKMRLDWLDRQKYGCWGKELFAGSLAAQTQIETGGAAYKGFSLRGAIDTANPPEIPEIAQHAQRRRSR